MGRRLLMGKGGHVSPGQSIIEIFSTADAPSTLADYRPSILESGTLTAVPLGHVAYQLAISESGTLADTPSATSAGLDSDTTAWISAVTTAGGSVSSGRQTTVNNLIVGLKSDGVWTKLDRLWLFAGENTESALIDLVARSSATAVNSPTFTTDRGYVSDGTTSYINTGYNASTQGVNFTLNSSHVALWDNTSRAAATTIATGVYDGTIVTDLFPYQAVFAATGLGFRIHGSGFDSTDFANSTSQGFFIGQRINSTTNQGYYNGTSLGTGSGTSNYLVNLPFFVCGRNDNGSLSTATTDRLTLSAPLTTTGLANGT